MRFSTSMHNLYCLVLCFVEASPASIFMLAMNISRQGQPKLHFSIWMKPRRLVKLKFATTVNHEIKRTNVLSRMRNYVWQTIGWNKRNKGVGSWSLRTKLNLKRTSATLKWHTCWEKSLYKDLVYNALFIQSMFNWWKIGLIHSHVSNQ